jgi:hypothetical protein
MRPHLFSIAALLFAASLAAAEPERPEAVATRFARAFESRDFATVRSLLAPEATVLRVALSRTGPPKHFRFAAREWADDAERNHAFLKDMKLEILDTRLLSVLTWYHISFFAISMAMFGMTAGAVHVYLGGDRFTGDNARRELVRYGRWYAIVVALAHVVSLCIPIHVTISLSFVLSMLLQSVVPVGVATLLGMASIAGLRLAAILWDLTLPAFTVPDHDPPGR